MKDGAVAPPFIDIVLDGPPGPDAGRFVEVEDDTGKSIKVGEWIDRGDGSYVLRIPRETAPAQPALTADDVRAVVLGMYDDIVRHPDTFGGPESKVEAIAARGSEKLAGRVVALSAEERAVAQAWRDTMDPIRGEREHNARSALLDRLLAGAPAVGPAQRGADLREAFTAGVRWGEGFSSAAARKHAQGCDTPDAAAEYARSKAGQRATLPPTSPDRIPPSIRASLDRYASAGIRTSDCLRHILAGDLFGAFARADAETSAAMPAIVAYIASQLPAACHGSEDLVEAWIARPRS